MSSQKRLNTRSSATKRILQEVKELQSDPGEFVALPLEEDLFEWHVTMRGSPGTDFEGGIYHIRISLPPTYPLSPPDISVLTPQGRFSPGHKLCIDGLTSFHTGSWMPAWGIRTAVVGLMSFWNQLGDGVQGVGYLNVGREERKRLAGISPRWKCDACGASNEEIMLDHEKMVKERKMDEEKMVVMDKGKAEEMAVRVLGAEVRSPQTTVIVTPEPVAPAPATTTTTTVITRSLASPPPPRTDPPRTLTVGPRPRTFLHTLLTPPPNYLAPLRIAHYYLLYISLPPHMHESYLPPPPDRVMFLDCVIWLVAIWLLLLCADKIALNMGWLDEEARAAFRPTAKPAAITGVGRSEMERPGGLELRIDGTANVGGRVAVGDGAMRRPQAAERV